MLLRGDVLLRRNPCCQGEMSNDLLPKAETVAQRCSVKKVFLEISQNSQENTCARASGLQLYYKRSSDTGIFL